MPRRADGVWTDADGKPLYYTDPNDPKWKRDAEMEFRGGRWVNKKTGTPSLMRDDLPRETSPGSGKWVWPDGTPVSDKDVKEISHQAAGNAPSADAQDFGVHGAAGEPPPLPPAPQALPPPSPTLADPMVQRAQEFEAQLARRSAGRRASMLAPGSAGESSSVSSVWTAPDPALLPLEDQLLRAETERRNARRKTGMTGPGEVLGSWGPLTPGGWLA